MNRTCENQQKKWNFYFKYLLKSATNRHMEIKIIYVIFSVVNIYFGTHSWTLICPTSFITLRGKSCESERKVGSFFFFFFWLVGWLVCRLVGWLVGLLLLLLFFGLFLSFFCFQDEYDKSEYVKETGPHKHMLQLKHFNTNKYQEHSFLIRIVKGTCVFFIRHFGLPCLMQLYIRLHLRDYRKFWNTERCKSFY